MKKNNKLYITEELKNKLMINTKSQYINDHIGQSAAAALYDKYSNDYICFGSYEKAIKYHWAELGMSSQQIDHLIEWIDIYSYLEYLYNYYKERGHIFTVWGDNEEEIEF